MGPLASAKSTWTFVAEESPILVIVAEMVTGSQGSPGTGVKAMSSLAMSKSGAKFEYNVFISVSLNTLL